MAGAGCSEWRFHFFGATTRRLRRVVYLRPTRRRRRVGAPGFVRVVCRVKARGLAPLRDHLPVQCPRGVRPGIDA